ncbi:DUF2642 domain-containing protein [Virgibacillus kimchii]
MSPLTDRQRNLLCLANQLSQNMMTTDDSNSNPSVSVDLPGIDFDVDLGFGRRETETPPSTPTTPATPATIREVMQSLVNEQVEITTPFDMITGTLLLVRDDYVVVVENSGAQVLVRIDKIELVSEL